MPETILVYVGIDAVGDGLIKLPFVRALRAAFPAARITWMAGKGHTVFADTLAPLVEGLIDEVLDEANIGSRAAELLRNPLPGRRFDLIIDTQRRLLTTLILKRIRHGRFISATAGFRLSDARPPEGERPAAMIAQMMRLLDAAQPGRDHHPAALRRDAATEALAERLLPAGPVYVGFAPGAGGKHKCWPLERFCQLAQSISAIPVFLLGPAETDWVETIRAALPQALLPLQQAEKPTPMLTIALARRMGAAVANDSGTGHMLACADIPLVSLFGPTPPAKFAPGAARLHLIRAQDFGGDAMTAIPITAVKQVLIKCLL
ncbi:ADP-heptose--LPS heptosyltransferase [Paramagnetospirillum kuznetsovii]|uniref:ADP-heptose--LPS heptosyltransferase n=1 Tax=Paramagnetospirillum kuznetsovii TaxID=2053833 RepID=A0A364NVD5_9PROT|nr:glycosyltransferase family 9 protein [Paramagnetospirillum kuznetsovii]RAU21049.1 ADP-heptose--LPS heptosyltransferase [Paramagnetospirillum kuznetsovii]